MSGVYIGFDGEADLIQRFGIPSGALEGAQILFAAYESPDYDGHGFVLFRKGGELYEVHGSHCSCDGLEGQWDPEETSWDAVKRYTTGNHWWATGEIQTALADLIIREDVTPL